MNREEIVKRLLGRGIMVTPDVLEKVEKQGIDSFLKSSAAGACTVVGAGGKEKLRCTVEPAGSRKEMTPEDVIAANAERYEKIRKMLLRKTDAVSINNTGKANAKVCIVGLVKEKTAGGIILEDGTGEIAVKTREAVEDDEVIGAKGWVREGVFFADEILYPDIPISREACSVEGTVLLSCDAGAPDPRADAVITPTFVSEDGKERRLPNPGWVSVERGGKKADLLVYRADGAVGKETAVSWLKRRFIGGGNVLVPDDGRVLDRVPDIMWIVSANEPWAQNYKGVTIVSFGKPRSALISLRDRKIEIR